ncbi:MAG TPA: hypothetical protein VII63_09970 [Caulobacteraceae bacterium]
MNVKWGSITALATLALWCGLAPVAQAEGGYKSCKVGDRVATGAEQLGTVTESLSNGVYCYVDLDHGDKHHYYIFWMLHAAGKPRVDPAQVANVAPGRYSCYAGAPLHYTFSDILVRSSSTYTDNKGNAGTYSYTPSTQIITFHSGSFRGAYAKYLENHAIGLASGPTTFFATVCDLKR